MGPARLIPAACSDAPILTDGRPRSVISRSNTVSAYISPFGCVPAGSTLRDARTRPRSSTISSARPRSTGGAPSATAGRICRERENQERQVHQSEHDQKRLNLHDVPPLTPPARRCPDQYI